MNDPEHQRRLKKRAEAVRVGIQIDRNLGVGRAVFRGVLQYARVHGPWTVLLNFQPGHGGTCHGAIGHFYSPEQLQPFLDAGLPVVNVGTSMRLPAVATVRADNYAAGTLAARHMLDKGYRRFAFLGSDRDAAHLRRTGFVDAVRAQHLPCDEFLYELDGSHAAASLADARQWITTVQKPAAVMCGEETSGWHAVGTCLDHGIAVPEEIAVITAGNDDLLCQASDVPLTSVEFAGERIGYEGAALLDRLMAGHAAPEDPVLIEPSGIVERQSTDVLAISDPHVVQALRLIREHACDGIGVPGILRRVPVNRRWLERRFRELLGRTPYVEILRVRVERARTLLRESDLAIAKIVERCGFNHVQNFRQIFRQVAGQTPAAFRRASRLGAAASL